MKDTWVCDCYTKPPEDKFFGGFGAFYLNINNKIIICSKPLIGYSLWFVSWCKAFFLFKGHSDANLVIVMISFYLFVLWFGGNSVKIITNKIITTENVVHIYYTVEKRKEEVIFTEYKTDKVTRVLMLYHQLISGQQVDKSLFSMEHNINERTFDRDIQDVRLFLSEIYSVDEIQFNKKLNSYQLTGQRPKYIDRMNAAVISKLIIDSKTLREDEMEGLLDIVMQTVSSRDAKFIKSYLEYDIKQYSSNTKSAVLKFIGDLYAVLNGGCDIELEYEKEDFVNEKVRISPLRLECANNEFYLIAAQDYSLDSVIKIPIDKIKHFNKLQTVFAKSLKEEYNQKED